MACSKFEYVKKFEKHEELLPQTYIVVRIDGKGFTKFCERHKLKKPNDMRLVNLMNSSALYVMNMFKDIFMAYGQSDEYSFAFKRDTQLFNRRSQKISTCLVSAFSSSFVFKWSQFFPEVPLKQPAIFDARCVVYPNFETLKDYFRWRQADCHINNLYNTTFWCMVKAGKSNTEVEQVLKDTNSGAKNQILFSTFGINYNTLPEVERKGSVLAYFERESKQKQISKEKVQLEKSQLKQQVNKEKKDIQEQILNQQKLPVLQSKIEKQGQTQHQEKQKNLKKKQKKKYQLGVKNIDIIKEDFWEKIKLN